MELGEPDESGRRRPVPVEGSEKILEVDNVIAAIGQVPDLSAISDTAEKDDDSMEAKLELTRWGTIVADEVDRSHVRAGRLRGGRRRHRGRHGHRGDSRGRAFRPCDRPHAQGRGRRRRRAPLQHTEGALGRASPRTSWPPSPARRGRRCPNSRSTRAYARSTRSSSGYSEEQALRRDGALSRVRLRLRLHVQAAPVRGRLRRVDRRLRRRRRRRPAGHATSVHSPGAREVHPVRPSASASARRSRARRRWASSGGASTLR